MCNAEANLANAQGLGNFLDAAAQFDQGFAQGIVFDFDVLVLLSVNEKLFLAFFILETDLVEVVPGALFAAARLHATLGLVRWQLP